jgi:hypothetical protein
MRRYLTYIAVPMMALMAALSGGCQPELQPSEDAVLTYLRSARVDGKVQRAWPEGQRYIDEVLAADAKLQKAIAPLRATFRPDALWLPTDPRWRDQEALSERVKSLTEALGDEASRKRDELTTALQDAIANIPKDLPAASDGPAGFIERVRAALALSGLDMGVSLPEGVDRAASYARQHLDLLTQVAELPPEAWSKDAPGLAVAEPAQREEIHAKHDDLRERIDEHVAAFCDYARQEMIDSLGRTRSMEGEGAPKRQFVLESSRRAFLRKQLENLPKPLRTAVEQARKDAPAGDAGTGGEAPSGLAQHLARLEAQLDSLSQRVESALGDVRAATTAESQ